MQSIPGVAHVERFGSGPPRLLVEVPHGADEHAHFVALRSQLGALPDDLEAFFFVNTDVGAYAYGRRVAELVGDALVVRCLIPRTFVDVNRMPGSPGGDLRKGGVTPGLHPYVRDPADRELLIGLHRQYLALCEAAYGEVVGAGGLALIPHTYAPRSVGIRTVGDDIGPLLRAAWATPDRWPLRPEVDFITQTPEGENRSIPGVADAVRKAYEADGIEVADSDTYHLHPETMGAVWAERFPGRTFCLEVRRDRLVAWGDDPFRELHADPARVDRFAVPLATALSTALESA